MPPSDWLQDLIWKGLPSTLRVLPPLSLRSWVISESKVREQVSSSTPPWLLLQFLPLGACLELLAWLPSLQRVILRWHKPFPPQVAFDQGLYFSNTNLTMTVSYKPQKSVWLTWGWAVRTVNSGDLILSVCKKAICTDRECTEAERCQSKCFSNPL